MYQNDLLHDPCLICKLINGSDETVFPTSPINRSSSQINLFDNHLRSLHPRLLFPAKPPSCSVHDIGWKDEWYIRKARLQNQRYFDWLMTKPAVNKSAELLSFLDGNLVCHTHTYEQLSYDLVLPSRARWTFGWLS